MKYYGISADAAAKLLEQNASLVREPTNSHDPNAIAVASNAKVLGHVDREMAAIVAPRIDRGANCELQIDAARCATGATIPVVILIEQQLEILTTPTICDRSTIGIYEIIVEGLGKSYIGQSMDIQERIKQHWEDLNRGIHGNPELRRLWHDYGPSKFSARVVEKASKFDREIDLARWLHSRECAWIEACGGVRNTINAEWPRALLSEIAKRQLQEERQRSAPVREKFKRDIAAIDQQLSLKHSAADECRNAIERSKRFWGVFNSAETDRNADLAKSRLQTIQAQISDFRNERTKTEGELSQLETPLLLRW